MKFLEALKGCNRGSPPVWLMRQAGRYLPEYRALRSNHSLREMFFTPKLSAEATLQPIRRFGFDAAILFSDITAIAPAMGFSLEFDEGPVVTPVATEQNWRFLKTNISLLDPIGEAAFLVKQQLNVPLIGFCGGPFTIATYLTKDWHSWKREEFASFLEFIAEHCIASLEKQIEAGVDAIQIFDSWANLLEEGDFEEYCLKPLQKILGRIDCPSIVFMRGSARRAEKLATLKTNGISVDWDRSLKEIRKEIRGTVKMVLQGNLNPDLLFAPLDCLRREVRRLLEEMEGDPAFIFNLGHGVKPGTPIEAVSAIIEEISQRQRS